MRIALNLQGKTAPACNHGKSEFGNLCVTYTLKNTNALIKSDEWSLYPDVWVSKIKF